MSLSDLIGAGKALADPIKAVGDLYTTDKARMEAEAQLTEADAKFQDVKQKPQLSLLEIVKILAASPNLFKSGFIAMSGWTAGFLMLCYYFPQIAIITYVWGRASIIAGHCEAFPMKPDDILNLVYVMCAGGVHHIVQSWGKK